MKRNNRNIFGLFVFWKAETKQEQLKRKKTIIDMQMRIVAGICQHWTASKDRFFGKSKVAQIEKSPTNES